jgi:hypothetical protein
MADKKPFSFEPTPVVETVEPLKVAKESAEDSVVRIMTAGGEENVKVDAAEYWAVFKKFKAERHSHKIHMCYDANKKEMHIKA